MYSVIKSNMDEALGIFNEAYETAAFDLGSDMLEQSCYVQEDEYEDWEGNEVELYESYAHCQGYQASFDAADCVIEAYSEYLEDDCDCDKESMRYDILTLLNKEIDF